MSLGSDEAGRARDPRTEAIVSFIGDLAAGRPATRLAPSGAGALDAIALALDLLAGELDARAAVHDRADARILDVLETIQAFAALDFGRQAQVLESGDAFDALAAGVNMLGEELTAAYAELEERVRARTAELADAHDRMEYRALHDALTGLPNRSLLLDRLEAGLAASSRHHRPLTLLLLDLDDFKIVNDRLGHDAGDHLLTDVGQRLAACLRPTDTVARVGGDEFAVLLPEADAASAGRVARRIVRTLRFSVPTQASPIAVSVSVGIAAALPGATASDVLRRADVALYAAKAAGRACQRTYSPRLERRRRA